MISEILGTNSKSYTNKLKQAKDYALEQLQDQANVGGNAIIGLSINNTMFLRDIIIGGLQMEQQCGSVQRRCTEAV